MNDADFAAKVLAEMAKGENKVYDNVYLFGSPDRCAEAAETLVAAYESNHPQDRIIRFHGPEFKSWIIDLVKKGYTYPIREIQQADLFVLQGVEAVAGQETTQEILYRTIDVLLRRKARFLITGDVPVLQLNHVADRILAQLEGCISCQV